MLILGVDTSTAQSSVCLGRETGLVAAATLGRGQAHSEFLTPAVAFCLEQAGLGIEDLTGVAVSLGPGLYTGMRVGIAAAQALAHARDLPVLGLNSLDMLAFEMRAAGPDRTVVAVIDARRGELFWAFYRPSADGVVRTTDLRVGPPEKLAGEVEGTQQRKVCVGDGAAAHESLLTGAGAEVIPGWAAHPSATALTQLAVPRFVRGETQRPEDLRPIYLRMADARIGWEQRGALAGGHPAPAPTREEGR